MYLLEDTREMFHRLLCMFRRWFAFTYCFLAFVMSLRCISDTTERPAPRAVARECQEVCVVLG